jgi:hypothetical protein
MTERMSDERLAHEHSYAEMLAEIDRARAAEAEDANSIDTLRATATLALEQLAASRAAEAELRAERDRIRAVVVAQADAWNAALWRASGSGDRAIHNADWQAACSHTEELGREMRGKS